MSAYRRKFIRLGEYALQLIDTDDQLIKAIEAGDRAGTQSARLLRTDIVSEIKQLAAWTPSGVVKQQ